MVVLMRAPRLMLASTTVAIALSAGAMGGPAHARDRRVIHVSAERFSFSPSEIVLEAGEEVELRLASEDTAHGFHIAGTDIDVVLPKRGQGDVSVVVRLDEPGRYEFECSKMCGAGHDFMRGTLVVRAPTGRDR